MDLLSWKDAVIQVLEQSDSAMHYANIAESILEQGYKEEVGATPANSVNTAINNSMKYEGADSPFVRVGRGYYFLREKLQVDQSLEHVIDHGAAEDNGLNQDDVIVNNSVIHAFGMYWERSEVSWTSNPRVLGRQQVGSSEVDFCNQKGVYLLHDGKSVVYVGRSVDRPLGRRLYEHTQDRLKGRWNRFSWFGLLSVTDEGNLRENMIEPSIETIIGTFEALLIEGLEPPLNRKRGDDFNAVEYLQVISPDVKNERFRIQLLNALMDMRTSS